MKVVSLFDGISGARLALLKAGIEVSKYYACEIDKYAIQVSKTNWPDIEHLGSITEVKFTQFKDVDLLIGGSPCTDLSIAKNNRKGLKGEQSKLFFEYVRALKELNPTYFLLENVASMSKDARKTISEFMRCEPVLIDSNTLSAQNRKRLYWTNIPVEIPEPLNIQLFRKGMIVHSWSKSARKDGSFDERIRVDGKTNSLTCSINGTESISFFPDEVLNFKPRKVWNRSDLYYHNISRAQKITPEEAEFLQTYPRGYTEGISDSQRYKCLGNSFTVDVIAHILRGIREDWRLL